jgi:hypothetical protein
MDSEEGSSRQDAAPTKFIGPFETLEGHFFQPFSRIKRPPVSRVNPAGALPDEVFQAGLTNLKSP